MALKACVECGKEIHEKVETCPSCGAPEPFVERIHCAYCDAHIPFLKERKDYWRWRISYDEAPTISSKCPKCGCPHPDNPDYKTFKKAIDIVKERESLVFDNIECECGYVARNKIKGNDSFPFFIDVWGKRFRYIIHQIKGMGFLLTLNIIAILSLLSVPVLVIQESKGFGDIIVEIFSGFFIIMILFAYIIAFTDSMNSYIDSYVEKKKGITKSPYMALNVFKYGSHTVYRPGNLGDYNDVSKFYNRWNSPSILDLDVLKIYVIHAMRYPKFIRRIFIDRYAANVFPCIFSDKNEGKPLIRLVCPNCGKEHDIYE